MLETHFINGKQVDKREWLQYSGSDRAKQDLEKSQKQGQRPIEIRGEKK